MSELPPPPTLYRLVTFGRDTSTLELEDVVQWELRDGIWFIVFADRSVMALPIANYQSVVIEPK